MNSWFMLTLVGGDKPGIVAKITKTLFENRCNLGEASMIRLGGNFTIMLMVSSALKADEIKNALVKVCSELQLRMHLDPIEGKLHNHHVPNVLVTVSGADRAGIVAQVTEQLFQCGFDILNLESDVAGTADKPLYIMQIEGQVKDGAEEIELALSSLRESGIDVHVQSIDTVLG